MFFESLPYLRSLVFWDVMQCRLVVFLTMCWDNSLVPTSGAKQSKPSPFFMPMMQCCSEGLFYWSASHHPKCIVANLEEDGFTFHTCVETRDRLPIQYLSHAPC